MMPHPERAIYSVSRPDYQLQKELARRKNLDVPKYVESNLSIFRNAIDYFKEL
jgi:phosphoribosylformylglycinamidine (FGAM) synthase-like amidotransferase family enzyme